MSYNKEIANKPLTGSEYDILILAEREQQHLVGEGEFQGYHIMPSDEYCELRDSYEKLVKKHAQAQAILKNEVILCISSGQ